MKYGYDYYEGKGSNYRKGGGYGSAWHRFVKLLLYRTAFSDLKRHKSSGRLLDLGCAYGYFVDFASRRGFQASGRDVSEYAVRRGKEIFPGLDIGRMDIERGIGFPEKSFDVVSAWDVLEHCGNLGYVLKEIKKVLKDDGVLLASVPDSDLFPEEKDLDGTHMWRMNMAEWKEQFERSGFEVASTRVFPFWLKSVKPDLCISILFARKAPARKARS